MKRDRHTPLTETTFYTLLALRRPAHGYLIMQKVRQMSEGKVDIAAGTMYGILDNLQKQGLIIQMGSADGRRKIYQITSQGDEVLNLDISRLQHMLDLARRWGNSNV